jgi:2-oxoglutarate dehydrogenase E2 component (dihydrolipoamide succinyltransferase)
MDLVVPTLGESISEAVIAKWLKKVGEPTAPDEPVVDLETDKINVQLPAPAAGVLAAQLFAEGATVRVGQVIGTIDEKAGAAARGGAATSGPKPEAKTPGPAPVAAAPAPAPVAAAPAPAPVAAAPLAAAAPATALPAGPPLSPHQRRLLREQGEARAAIATPPAPVAAPSPALSPSSSPSPSPMTDVQQVARPAPREEVVPMSPLRKRIAERLVEAQHAAAVLTTFNEVDMSAIMALRARHQDAFVARHGIKLGFMSFFTKAVVAALVEFPMLNAEIRGTDMIYKKHYDIGIAVGSGRGLVVPVLRNADRLSFAEIEKGIAALAAKVKDQKLTLDDLSGGTFTITNGGIYGSMMSTPLLNMPQTGILGMHNIVKRAVVVGDQVAVRPMMYLAVSYDHRLVDGREAVQFLVGVKERVEDPERLMFSL